MTAAIPKDDLPEYEDEAPRRNWWLLLVLLPIVVAIVAVWFVVAVLLLLVVWLTWHPRGRYAIVVHSNSTTWQDYFATEILPAVGDRAVVLNWSERKRWKPSFAVVLFRVFAGDRNFNPLAIVFPPFAPPRFFRFYRPFRAFKHGRPGEVEALRRDLLATLDGLAPRRPGPDPA